ncbi:MAG: hypothetical protein KC912_23755 [Proteobacteria bacterium]|nr:hypothetical protein [Pseudomonadota bacterium]
MNNALTQLGDAAKLYLTAQTGLPPDLIDLMQELGEHDELIAALRDPRVRTLMKDRETVRGLAAFIQQAAESAVGPQVPAPDAPVHDGPTA